MTHDLIARLEAATEGSCVLWPRATDERGRGQIWENGKKMLAHRWAWEKVNGPIPAGKLICHHCDNPGCINPHHLYVGTHADNMRDMRERGRSTAARYPELARELGRRTGRRNTHTRGEGNPRAKLTAEQATAIRSDKRPTKLVAADYGVDQSTVQRIRRGKLWIAALRARTPSTEETR